MLVKMISLKYNSIIFASDFFKEFLTEPTALSASELLWGWYAELCLCLTPNKFILYLKVFLKAPPESEMMRYG